MAVTTNRDLVATDDPLSNDLAVSMESQVADLETDTTQFTTLLMKLPAQTANSFKEQWLEDQYLPRNTALSATASSVDTTLSVTTSEGNYAKPGDVAKFVQTGEAFRITTVGASAWTVVRAIGSVGAASAASGTSNGGIVLVTGSNEQGAELPTALITQKTTNYNYTGIARNAFRFTATTEWVNWYSGPQLPYHRKKVAIEHKREIENSLWFGARSYSTGSNAPITTSGGIDEFLSTNITDVGGQLTKSAFNDFLRSGLEFGTPSRKILFVSPLVGQVLSQFLGDNWVRATPTDNVWGVQVTAVISPSSGASIPVVVKHDWKRFGEGTGKHIGSRAYLVDLTNVELKRAPATSQGPRFATLYTNRQNPSADETAEEYLSEYTLLVKQEKTHALLRGVTS